MNINNWKIGEWANLCIRIALIIFTVMIVLTNDNEYDVKAISGAAALLLTFLVTAGLRHYNLNLPWYISPLMNIFIFLSMCLGKMLDFYVIYPWWDLFLHAYSGALFCVIGSLLMDVSAKNASYRTVIFGGICFSLASSVSWEYFEYAGDVLFGFNSQIRTLYKNLPPMELSQYVDKWGRIRETGLENTMTDLISGGAGAAAAAIGWALFKRKKDRQAPSGA